MKGLKRLAGVLGVIVLLCGMLTGCSGKKLYSEEELTQIHDVIGTVEQMTKEFQNVITDSLPTLLGDMSSSSDDLMDFISTRKYDPNKKIIALTFDDGPSTDETNGTSDLLDLLEQYDSKATFFCLGNRLNDESAPLLKRMVELGCEIGNHSFDHADLATLSAEDVTSQLSRTDEEIQNLVGHSATVVRPPYGSFNDTVAGIAARPLIMWSVDTLDWETQNADSTVQNVMDNAQDGAIILMHDIFKESVDAAEVFIPQLIQEGYQLVTVSELAAAKGITLEAGTSYGAF